MCLLIFIMLKRVSYKAFSHEILIVMQYLLGYMALRLLLSYYAVTICNTITYCNRDMQSVVKAFQIGYILAENLLRMIDCTHTGLSGAIFRISNLWLHLSVRRSVK